MCVSLQVMAHSTPQGILDDVAMVSSYLLITAGTSSVSKGSLCLQVLDEEAEVFIVKMWRLLIYETEAKKIGLVK